MPHRQVPRVHLHYDGLGWSLRCAAAVASLGVAAVVLFAVSQRSAIAWGVALACLVWSLVVLAWMRWRACPGELSWDGTQWHWQAEAAARSEPCRVRLCLDLHHRLLVRVQPQGRFHPHWLWLQRRHPTQWHLVRAVLCSAGQP